MNSSGKVRPSALTIKKTRIPELLSEAERAELKAMKRSPDSEQSFTDHKYLTGKQRSLNVFRQYSNHPPAKPVAFHMRA